MPVNIARIVRSKRRTIALIVERDGTVTVRAPMKMAMKSIMEFVEKHADWVEKKQEEVKSIVPEQPRRYEDGEDFFFLGQSYPLEIVNGSKKPLVLTDTFKLEASEQKNAETIFRNWYRRQAAKIIGDRVTYFAEQYQIPMDKIRITSARTRWGSCSPKNKLSFSWRLVMTPLDVIDYVVIHELAHTVHHNHSQRFWSLVEKWMPDYKRRRKQLRQYGREII